MSKMDALRAMREANAAEVAKRAARSTPAGAAPTAPARASKPRAARAAAAPVDTGSSTEADESVQPAEELCGHKNMSGRSCTREKGHAAKSHRYS